MHLASSSNPRKRFNIGEENEYVQNLNDEIISIIHQQTAKMQSTLSKLDEQN